MENIFLKILAIIMSIIGTIWIFEKILFLFSKDIYCYNNKNCIFFSILNFLKSIFPVLFLIFIIRSFIFEPFYIPSESMIPTLLPGDCIIVKKFMYGINNPFNNTQLISYNHPKRSDIIVFKNSKNSNIYYIKRIIGIPGDKIIYDSLNKIITIYEKYNTHNYKKKY